MVIKPLNYTQKVQHFQALKGLRFWCESSMWDQGSGLVKVRKEG